MKIFTCRIMATVLFLCCHHVMVNAKTKPLPNIPFFQATTQEMHDYFAEADAAYGAGDYALMADIVADLLVLNLTTSPELLILAEEASSFKEKSGFDWLTVTSLIRDDANRYLAMIVRFYPKALEQFKHDVGKDAGDFVDKSLEYIWTPAQKADPRAAHFLKRAEQWLNSHYQGKSAVIEGRDLRVKLLKTLLVLTNAFSPNMIRAAEKMYNVEGTILPLLAYIDVRQQLVAISERHPEALKKLKQEVGAQTAKAIDIMLDEIKRQQEEASHARASEPVLDELTYKEKMLYGDNVVSVTYAIPPNITNPQYPEGFYGTYLMPPKNITKQNHQQAY